MRSYKILSLLLALTLIAATGLTGCSVTDKAELLNALEKSSQMTSCESYSQMRFTNVTFDTNIEDLEVFQFFIPLLDGMGLEINQKINTNKEGTKVTMQTDSKATASDISEQTTLWASIDLEQQPPLNRQIIKLPATFTASLPEDLAGKEYFVIDEDDLPEVEQGNQQEYDELANAITDFQANLIELLKEHALNKDPNFVVITQLDDKVVNGERLSVYQVKLDNKSLKTILRYVLSELSENEQAKEIIKEMVVTMGTLAEGREAGEDLQLALDTLANGDKTLKEELDIIMNALDDVTMLGSRGIEINYMINEDGYIVNQNGVFDFYMDSQEVEDAFEKISEETYDGKEIYKFTFGMAMEFNTDISSINQPVNIDFPVITEENSFDFNDFLGIAPTFGRKLVKQNASAVRMDFSNASSEKVFPVKLGDKTFVPLEPVSRKLGLKLSVQKNGEFILNTSKGEIKGKAGSTEIMVNDKKQYLPMPVMKIENQIFVPDQFVTKCMTNGMYYNEKTKELVIQKR
ncbi:MAG TPA: copper amine oxidase N-terminal domain-containing protein [Candidatus Nitrosocosmicus sp.]|nr:copper amine oxidase N-terminal domain-containing protein [Candidatus Nitrosocosmicus sp.]